MKTTMKLNRLRWWSIKCGMSRWPPNQVYLHHREDPPLKPNSISKCSSPPNSMRNQAAPLSMAAHRTCREGWKVLIRPAITIKNRCRRKMTTTATRRHKKFKSPPLMTSALTRHQNSLPCLRSLSLSMTRRYRPKNQMLAVTRFRSMRLVRSSMKRKQQWVSQSLQIIWLRHSLWFTYLGSRRCVKYFLKPGICERKEFQRSKISFCRVAIRTKLKFS